MVMRAGCLLVFLGLTLAVLQCPTESPCIGCNEACEYECINIPAGNHKGTIEEQAYLHTHGYTSLTSASTLQYQVVFHENTVTYSTTAEAKTCEKYMCSLPYCPCLKWKTGEQYLGGNMNKLFGVTRGIVPVMSKSCMFAWRRTLPDKGEKEGQLFVSAYGWKNSRLKPWQTPGQMPHMANLDVNTPYLFRIIKREDSCEYYIYSADNQLIARNTTDQEPGGVGVGANFALYFGGSVPAPEAVTVSFSTSPACTSAHLTNNKVLFIKKPVDRISSSPSFEVSVVASAFSTPPLSPLMLLLLSAVAFVVC